MRTKTSVFISSSAPPMVPRFWRATSYSRELCLASQLTPHPPSATAVACERLSPKLCTTGISLGEAQHNSPWRQPWASGRWMNEPRKDLQAILHNYRGERQGKQFISHPDSFTLPGLVLASP